MSILTSYMKRGVNPFFVVWSMKALLSNNISTIEEFPIKDAEQTVNKHPMQLKFQLHETQWNVLCRCAIAAHLNQILMSFAFGFVFSVEDGSVLRKVRPDQLLHSHSINFIECHAMVLQNIYKYVSTLNDWWTPSDGSYFMENSSLNLWSMCK